MPDISRYDLNTSAGGRGYVAEYFAKRMRRHDFKRYIAQDLAADFACALAAHLRACDDASQMPIYQVWIEETSSYADVTREYYTERQPSNRRIVYGAPRPAAAPRTMAEVFDQLEKIKTDPKLLEQLRAAAQAVEPRLEKPAQVGNGRFSAGVKWSTVIGAAQRHHEYMNTPEKEAARIAAGNAWLADFHRETAALTDKPGCWCETCRPVTVADMRMVLCPTCGDKRCPHATNHENACAGSSEPCNSFECLAGQRDGINAPTTHAISPLACAALTQKVTSPHNWGPLKDRQ